MRFSEEYLTGSIVELKKLRDTLLDRRKDLEETYQMSGHNAICNRIAQIDEVLRVIEQRVYELSPSDCDW